MVAILVLNVLSNACTGGSNMRLSLSALTIITLAALGLTPGRLEPQHGNYLEHAKAAPDPDFHSE